MDKSTRDIKEILSILVENAIDQNPKLLYSYKTDLNRAKHLVINLYEDPKPHFTVGEIVMCTLNRGDVKMTITDIQDAYISGVILDSPKGLFLTGIDIQNCRKL